MRLVFLIESVVIIASVIAAYALHWRMSISPWIAIPSGIVLWASGLIWTVRLRSRLRKAVDKSMPLIRPRGYPMVEAKAAMHLGAAVGFRSWPTLAAAGIFFLFNLWMAVSARRRIRGRGRMGTGGYKARRR